MVLGQLVPGQKVPALKRRMRTKSPRNNFLRGQLVPGQDDPKKLYTIIHIIKHLIFENVYYIF